MVQKDTQFVMKNHKVVQPFVPTDGLELYYDVKGKKNTDNYKGTLLDMSGNGRHGTLSNFAYEGVSGFTGTTEGGLLLDDVDDKIVRPAISGIEYTSASRNLFDKSVIVMGKYHNSGGVLTNEATSSGSEFFVEVESGKTYTWGDIDRYKIIVMTFDENKLPLERFTAYTILSRQFNSNVKYVQFSSYQVNYTFSDFQVEEGTVATPYTPYIPLPIMTYQMNGNILSFEKDGTVKRTTKDVNGNEVVVSRKGINLVRNGNFTNGKDKWMGGVKLASAIVDNSSVVLTANTESGEHYFDQNFRMPSPSSKYLVKFKIKSIIGRGYIVAYNYRLDGTYENLGRSSIVSESVETELSFIVENTTTHLVNPHIIVRLQLSNTSAQGIFTGSGEKSSFTDIQLINLTEAYGAGNEPILEYIQSHPEEFAWTPNPNDLIETVEIKNNLVGDLENLQGNDFEQHEDGVVTYTNEAEEGSVVRVDIDGISDQPLRFRNATGEQVVITEHDQIDEDSIKKVEFQGNSVQLADKYREVSGTSVTIAPELHDRNVTDKLVIGGNTYQYTESSNVVTDGLEMWLSGRNFSNSPATTTWKDLTGVNNGTASGFAFASASGSDGNGGVVFDGVDDKVTINSFPSSKYLTTGTEKTPITLEIWAKSKTTTSDAVLLFGRLGSHSGLRFESGNIIAKMWSDIGHQVTAPIPNNTLFHAVAVIFDRVLSLYVNGIIVGSTNISGDYRSITGSFLINGTSNFNGNIYSARIYSKALTDTEILQNYNAGLAIPIPNIAMPQEVKHVTSGSKVLVHGKNLFDKNATPINMLQYVSSTTYQNGIRVVSTSISDYVYASYLIKLKPDTSYFLNTTIIKISGGQNILVKDGLDSSVLRYGVGVFKTDSTGSILIKFASNQGLPETGNVVYDNIQLEEGATATAYEPFKGYQETTIPVTLKGIG